MTSVDLIDLLCRVSSDKGYEDGALVPKYIEPQIASRDTAVVFCTLLMIIKWVTRVRQTLRDKQTERIPEKYVDAIALNAFSLGYKAPSYSVRRRYTSHSLQSTGFVPIPLYSFHRQEQQILIIATKIQKTTSQIERMLIPVKRLMVPPRRPKRSEMRKGKKTK